MGELILDQQTEGIINKPLAGDYDLYALLGQQVKHPVSDSTGNDHMCSVQCVGHCLMMIGWLTRLKRRNGNMKSIDS